MSFALTVPQIQSGTKDVTRRLGWLQLKPGDLIQPVRKCMGLRPGESIERLRAPLRIVDVRREPLDMMTTDLDYGMAEVRREGFADHPTYRWPSEWVRMFCASHKGCMPHSVVTRIEFAYTQAEESHV
ncbi:hypothetical protein [Roseateles sp. BYS96W]|uniref:ASCH domain-containing protein n=1 Tax=Pelomonas nitida TaxID=3299027 RepID=A0ABW7G7P0_9BURK